MATIQRSAHVIEGVSRSRNALIDGKLKQYDWDSGYTCHQLGSGAIVIQLAQPYIIGSMRYTPHCQPSVCHMMLRALHSSLLRLSAGRVKFWII